MNAGSRAAIRERTARNSSTFNPTPLESINLADKPDYAARVAELTAALQTLQRRFGDVASLKVANLTSAA